MDDSLHGFGGGLWREQKKVNEAMLLVYFVANTHGASEKVTIIRPLQVLAMHKNTNQNSNFSLEKPPWSNQEVSNWIRVLAWFWVVLVIVCSPFAIWLAIQDGVSSETLIDVFSMVLVESYMTLLFAHAAITGRAPIGWRPWKTS